MYATRAAKREPCPTHARPTTHCSITYQNAIKEANEWVETAKSSDEPTSHDLNPPATLPRLEFVSEARAASDSKQLGVGHAGAGGAARLASLPQPTFRFVTGEITTAAAEAECSVSSPAEVCQLSLKSSDPRCWHGL